MVRQDTKRENGTELNSKLVESFFEGMADFSLLRKQSARLHVGDSGSLPASPSGGAGSDEIGGKQKKMSRWQRRKSDSTASPPSPGGQRRRHSGGSAHGLRTAFPFDKMVSTITTNGVPTAWRAIKSTDGWATTSSTVATVAESPTLQFPLQSGDRVRVTGYGLGTVRFYGA